MKKIILLFFCPLIFFACSKQDAGTSNQAHNNLSRISVTGEYSGLGPSFVTLHGWANIPNEFKLICFFGVQVSTTSSFGSNIKEMQSNTMDSDNKYSVSVSNLEYATKYYYRSYVKYISTGTYEYGEVRSFETEACKPTFNNEERGIFSISFTEVNLWFELDNDGGAEVRNVCVYYSKSNLDRYDIPDMIDRGLTKKVQVTTNGHEYRCKIDGLEELTQYYAVCYAKNSVGGSFSHAIPFLTFPSAPNSEDAVDLGLSVLWASKNLGSKSLIELGDSYSWGETEFNKYTNGKSGYAKYNSTDKKTVLEPEDDIAHMTLGGKWRMPTHEEVEELWQNCEQIYINCGDWEGIILKSKVKGYEKNSLVFPRCSKIGFDLHWTSSLFDRYNAYSFGPWWDNDYDESFIEYPLLRSGFYANINKNRDSRFQIRPVREK